MHKLILALMSALLVVPVAVFAEGDYNRFEAGVEAGGVYLTAPAADYLESAPGYGLTLGYNLGPHFGLHLSAMASVHGDDDLEGDQDAELTMVSVIPSLRWRTGGKFNVWFSCGMGATVVDSELEEGDARAENTETAFATSLRLGVDYFFMKNYFAGLAGGVQTAALEEENPAGKEEWEINTFYVTALRLGYAF